MLYVDSLEAPKTFSSQVHVWSFQKERFTVGDSEGCVKKNTKKILASPEEQKTSEDAGKR